MDLKNFAIIRGENVTIDGGRIIFKPKKKVRNSKSVAIQKDNESKSSKNLYSATIRTDVIFSEGTVELKLKVNTSPIGCLFIFKSEPLDIAVGHSGNLNAFVVMDDNMSATPDEIAGSLSHFKMNEILKLKIIVIGSQIQLYVNEILFFQTHIYIQSSPIELRLTSLGSEVEVYDIKVSLTKPKLFVVMQFSEEYNELYEEVIKPVVEDFGFQCVRADEFYTTTPILKDIIENIEQSKAIIAEITPDNPNVFYEIGYSHAIRKPTILLCDHKREKLPFDISSFRTLFYENTIAGKKKVEASLKQYLEQIK